MHGNVNAFLQVPAQSADLRSDSSQANWVAQVTSGSCFTIAAAQTCFLTTSGIVVAVKMSLPVNIAQPATDV